MSIELHDGTQVSKKKLLEIVSRGRERIRLGKNDWLIADDWIDGAASRRELLDLYNHLLKSDGRRIEIIPVDRALFEAENVTDDVPEEFDNIFFKTKSRSRRVKLDSGQTWVLRLRD